MNFGGGIYNSGKLTLVNSTVSHNEATGSGGDNFGAGGGIENIVGGTLTVTNSTLSGNLVTGNPTAKGGGISNDGKLTVTHSNGTSGFGGGIYNGARGILMVANCNFSGNLASGKKGGGGGGILSFGYTIIRFSTIYGNTSSLVGGGIAVDTTGGGHMTMSSNIIAANNAPNAPDLFGVLTSGGYNLIENLAGVTGLNVSTDKQVTLTELGISPTLGNNGGPTQTFALLSGSKAIDAVPLQACSITIPDASSHNVTITTDQRGDRRPDGSEKMCDIGAYESSY